MFKTGEFVLKNGFGILEVKETSVASLGFGVPAVEYYKLQSIDGKTNVSVPVSRASTLLSPLLTKKEAENVLKNILTYAVPLDSNEKIRRKFLETRANQGRDGCLEVLGSLYTRILSGKKLSFYEKNALEIAENKIYGEIAFVFKKDKDAVLLDTYKNLGLS